MSENGNIPGGRVREVPLSAVTSLLSLPQTVQIQALEAKLELLTLRVAELGRSLDQLSANFSKAISVPHIHRIDHQIADLRNLFTKLGGSAPPASKPSSQSE